MSAPLLPTPSLVPAATEGRISVVMVSFMTGQALIESIQAVISDPDIAELILVDNGNLAADRMRLFDVASENDKVRVLQGHGNVGFATGCNYGAGMATGDYLFFLNPDAIIETGAAQALANAGQAARSPWLTGGILVDENKQEQRGARRGELTPLSLLISFSPLQRIAGLPSMHRDDEPMPTGPVLMPTISGASALMDRASFDRVGGFDEDYFLHVEDIALCRSVRDAGGDVIFVPGARAMHYRSTSEIARWQVERHKLNSLIRYFWTSGPGLAPKIGTILGAPILAGAVLARLILLNVIDIKRRR